MNTKKSRNRYTPICKSSKLTRLFVLVSSCLLTNTEPAQYSLFYIEFYVLRDIQYSLEHASISCRLPACYNSESRGIKLQRPSLWQHNLHGRLKHATLYRSSNRSPDSLIPRLIIGDPASHENPRLSLPLHKHPQEPLFRPTAHMILFYIWEWISYLLGYSFVVLFLIEVLINILIDPIHIDTILCALYVLPELLFIQVDLFALR